MRAKTLRGIGLGFCAVLLCACSNLPVETYSANQPVLTLSSFFNGPLTAHGIVKNRQGKVTRYFNVTMDGQWDSEGNGVLVEDFVWDDGEKQQRIWRFESKEDGAIWAHADDVKKPVPVNLSGNALFLAYQLLVPVGNSKIWLTVDDRMYLVDNDVLINDSVLKKFGIRVGEVTLTIVKQ